MGRKVFEPTSEERQKVYSLTGAGFTVEEIAKVIYRYGKPISDKTVRKYFRRELETARIEAVVAVSNRLFKKAMEGDTTAMIFYLKTRGGWKESKICELSGIDGKAIKQETTLNLSGLTADELERLEEIFEKQNS